MPGDFQRVRIDVGGKHLQPTVLLRDRKLFEQEDGQAVRFLSGGAAGDPDPERSVGIPGLDERDQRLGLQGLQGLRITEEAGHADEQVANQLLDFVGMFAQVGDVFGHVLNLVEPHAPLDAPNQHLLAVTAEVEPGTRPQQGQQLVEMIRLALAFGSVRAAIDVKVLHKVDQRRGHLFRGQDIIGQTGGDGALRHAGICGGGGILDHGHAARGLDRFEAEGSVRAGAAEDDADGLFHLVLGQGAQKKIDRGLHAAALDGAGEAENASANRHVFVRRQDVNAVGRDGHTFLGFDHSHGGVPGEQFDHKAFVPRIEVGNKDKSDPAFQTAWPRRTS